MTAGKGSSGENAAIFRPYLFSIFYKRRSVQNPYEMKMRILGVC
jgi:hypothetical protein